MALILDLFLSNLPKLNAKGDWPGNLGCFILVKVSDKNRPSASIKCSPFFLSEAKILPLAITASLILASADFEIALFLSK